MSIRPNTEGRFPKLILPFYGDVSLGNSTMYKMGMFTCPNGRLFLGIENKGAYTFGGWCHYSYAQEKLGLRFSGDAKSVADLINCQLGNPLEFEGRVCQGEYNKDMCEIGDGE